MNRANQPQAAGHAMASHDGAPLLWRDAHHCKISLNRPAEHNRLDPRDIDALRATLTDLSRSDCPKSLVITGGGSRSFSSGYTLDAITTELDDRFEEMLDQLEALPFLTIAAINGNVYGGATDLALCCDIRIGQIGTRMQMPAANIGLHYYPGGLRRYVNRLGLTTATRLMLTGMPMPASDMLRTGYLTELVEPDDMAAAVKRYTDAAQATDSRVVAQMKAHMHEIASTVDSSTDLSKRMQAAYTRSVASPELAARVAKLLNDN